MTDSSFHCVQVLNSDLDYCSTIGREGSGNGEFNSPWGISCDSTGNVYVADTHNHRIQVFAAEGTFLRMYVFGSDNEGSCPAGIAIDTSGLNQVASF